MAKYLRIVIKTERLLKMCREVKCKECEYAEDLKGCATKHIGEARRLLSEGNVREADLQLSYIEKHLKEK